VVDRPAATHVIILDGTLSSLVPPCQTNAGRLYGLMREMGRGISLFYGPGLQWEDWRSAPAVLAGRGINQQIRAAYGWLASRYRSGDRIYLFGYSRGAFAVRSLAGLIDLVGLLRAEHATERNIRAAYRHYEFTPDSAAAHAFAGAHCHARVEIEMIGVWDTVKSLGINAPVLWRLSEQRHAFHNHDLSGVVKNGFQALAHDETRVAFSPVLWRTDPRFEGRVEQVWFPGAHGDVGGQLGGYEAARPLANIPLFWMLSRAQECGLPLPEDALTRFPMDPLAPARGTWHGRARFLITRRRRVVGADPSERIHESVGLRAAAFQGASPHRAMARFPRSLLGKVKAHTD
jgi:uncharacterized protein (DUF2235 family)